MMKIFRKLICFMIIGICLSSCSSRNNNKNNITVNGEEKKDQDNDNQLLSLAIDSIDVNQLINSRWLQIVTSDCINYLLFNEDGTYNNDNCELEYFFEGKYMTSKDSIFLLEYDLKTQLPGENRLVNTAIYTYIYQKDSLKLISNKRIKEGEIVSTYYPNLPIYYRRE